MNKLELALWGIRVRASGKLAVLGAVFLGVLVLLLR